MNRKAIEKRLAEIKLELEKSDSNFEDLEKEARELLDQLNDIERRSSLLTDIASCAKEVVETPQPQSMNTSEARGKALKENRSVTVGSSTLVVPKYASDQVSPAFTQVSALIDMVNIEELPGGESYEKGYEKNSADGGYTNEGSDYTEADTSFGYAKLEKTKITAYSEESEEAIKLPAANYDELVMNGISRSLRKKIAKEIMVGDGTSGHLVGIFDDQATAIQASTDLEIQAIDENTLDSIIFGYGGEESVEGSTAALILNKKDLAAFAKIKGTDKKRVYDIVLNGSTGTINGTPFVINSACKPLSDATTAAGAYCMAFGYLSNYTVSLFADVEVVRSTDYKFRSGMIAHRGSALIGGNVTAFNGFIRVKKSA